MFTHVMAAAWRHGSQTWQEPTRLDVAHWLAGNRAGAVDGAPDERRAPRLECCAQLLFKFRAQQEFMGNISYGGHAWNYRLGNIPDCGFMFP